MEDGRRGEPIDFVIAQSLVCISIALCNKMSD